MPVNRAEFEELVRKVEENTALTREIGDAIKALGLLAKVAKWLGIIATAGTACFAFVRQVKGV